MSFIEKEEKKEGLYRWEKVVKEEKGDRSSRVDDSD